MAHKSTRLIGIPCFLAAVVCSAQALGAEQAELVDVPKAESTSVSSLPSETPTPPPAPEEPPAEIIPLPPSKRSLEQAKPGTPEKKTKPAASETAAAPKNEKPSKSSSDTSESAAAKTEKTPPSPAAPEKEKTAAASPEARKDALAPFMKPAEPGYTTVLSGTLTEDLELTPQMSPVLIRGAFIVPEKIKLTILAGTIVHLRADPQAATPAPGTPDPAQSAVLWIWGTLAGGGVTGNPAEIANQENAGAALLLYGVNDCKLDGVRLKGVNVAQNGGTALWTNCEFVGSGSYAMAAGAGIFTQCTFRKFGGIFATYNVAPWSLLVRKSLFERCREGIILGSNPGEARLVVEKNHFIGTQGAHIRALPLAKAKLSADAKKSEDMEVLIGENWYGSAIPEEVDMRIVDRRNDPAIHARLNTRPPANQPYANIGAGMKAAVLEATNKEQQSTQQKLLQAHLAREKTLSGPSRQLAKRGT